MNLTRHIKQRYCERILKVSESDLKAYMVEHDERITADLQKMFEHAAFFWRGQVYDNTTKSYYLNGDIVMVVSDDQNLVTLFCVDFGFPPDVNRQTLKGLVKEKAKHEAQAEKLQSSIDKETEPTRAEIAGIEEQLTHIRAQLELLEQRKQALESELSTSSYKVSALRHEADRLAKMICNSMEYRKDLLDTRSWKVG